MFTGIIEEAGIVTAIEVNKISISAKAIIEGTKVGDSIDVNGVCLTVTNLTSSGFDADISPETLKVTALGNLKTGDLVNLERALLSDGRFGGHVVTGHTDCKGVCKNITRSGDFYVFEFELPEEYTKYTVKKGSVTVNGISLTIAEINNNRFTVAVIPHTFQNTNLKALKVGSFVNIETDILAKYIEKFLLTSDNKAGISMKFLRENGF